MDGKDEHLDEHAAHRFAAGGSPPEEARRIVAHLLGGCRWCGRRLGPVVALANGVDPGPAGEAEGERYEEPLRRAAFRARELEAHLAAEREAAAPLLARIRERPRGLAAATDEELASLPPLPLVEALLQASAEERYRDPQAMWRYAFEAQLATGRLDRAVYGELLVADVQARVFGELGNAYRVVDQLAEAQAALDAASDCMVRGSGDLLLGARLGDLQATLDADRRRFPEALELLDWVERLYRQSGDLHLAGRARVKQGIYTNYAGEPERAIPLLRQGISLLDRKRDPQLVASATQSLLVLLSEAGDFREAGRLLLESDLRRALAGEPLNLIKLRWVEGKILAGLSRLGRAERAFAEARAGFEEHKLGYRAALVALDLAAVWLKQGRAAEVQELAEEVADTFEELGVPTEAARAVGYVVAAGERQVLTAAALGHVVRFLSRLEREPGLRFERP